MYPLFLLAGIFIFFLFSGCRKTANSAGNGYELCDTAAIHECELICGIGPAAEFPGGHKAWLAFLKKEANADALVEKGAPAGSYTVVVQFSIDRDGSVFNVKALTDIGYGAEDEAVRVIRKSPRWQPEIFNEEPVIIAQKQPLIFHIQ